MARTHSATARDGTPCDSGVAGANDRAAYECDTAARTSAAEARKEAEKLAANDPLNAIRDSLDKIERELTDTILQNRIETV